MHTLGAIAKEQVAAIDNAEIQSILQDPIIKQLLHHAEEDAEKAGKALEDPETKVDIYAIYYILYTIHYTLYTTHYTLYTIHYTLYTISTIPIG